jgi:hypothetical protein
MTRQPPTGIVTVGEMTSVDILSLIVQSVSSTGDDVLLKISIHSSFGSVPRGSYNTSLIRRVDEEAPKRGERCDERSKMERSRPSRTVFLRCLLEIIDIPPCEVLLG